MSTKNITIEQGDNGLYFAKYQGGGQLPAYLGGAWTKENDLKARIQLYLQTRRVQTPAQKQERAKTTSVQKRSSQNNKTARAAKSVTNKEE